MKPKEAREFLDNYYVQGRKVSCIYTFSGKKIEFSEMTDEQAVHYAKQIKEEWLPKQNHGLPGDTKIIRKDIN